MVTTSSKADPLALARDALERGEWDAALHALEAASEDAPAAERLELLAAAAYGAGDLEGTLTAWEDLHALHRGAGDDLAAAHAASMVALYLMMDTGLMAPVRGWLRRTERLLADHEDTPVHATLAMIRMYERLMSGDLDQAATWAERAIDAGTRHGVPPAVALGRVAAARVRILEGDVDEGLESLDEVAALLAAGELDPLPTGMVYCELICAVQGLAQYDRAEQWTQAMERWRRGVAFGGINGRCRVHRAEILRLRGFCDEAEDEALHACEELRPWMRREFGWPLAELGTIRLRRGDLAGAEEAFLAAHENAWDPQPGLALVRLAQGDVEAAAALIRDALDRPFDIPWKERPPSGGLRRAPLLDAQVEIAVAAGDLDTAEAAADELHTVATTYGSRALEAAAALARARVALARGEVAPAVRAAESAVSAWAALGAPYEAAVARTVLARAHEQDGNGACARLEWGAARTTFERVGAVRWERTAAHALGESGACAPSADEALEGAPASTHAPNVFRCDGDTRTVTFAGETVLLRDLKGLRYLERLLAEPGREFHVLDLVAVERGSLPVRSTPGPDADAVTSGGDAGLLLDERAREAYRRRLAEVDEDIEDAVAMSDPERASRARIDRDYLVRELSRAVGLGGRPRRAGATSERARSSVTQALRYAQARIGEHHPQLAEHLTATLRTGTYCAYTPDPRAPITWEV